MLTGGVQSGPRAEHEPRWVQKGDPRVDTIWPLGCRVVRHFGPEGLQSRFPGPSSLQKRSEFNQILTQMPSTSGQTKPQKPWLHTNCQDMLRTKKLTIQPMERPCTPLDGWPTRLPADLCPQPLQKNPCAPAHKAWPGRLRGALSIKLLESHQLVFFSQKLNWGLLNRLKMLPLSPL